MAEDIMFFYIAYTKINSTAISVAKIKLDILENVFLYPISIFSKQNGYNETAFLHYYAKLLEI